MSFQLKDRVFQATWSTAWLKKRFAKNRLFFEINDNIRKRHFFYQSFDFQCSFSAVAVMMGNHSFIGQTISFSRKSRELWTRLKYSLTIHNLLSDQLTRLENVFPLNCLTYVLQPLCTTILAFALPKVSDKFTIALIPSFNKAFPNLVCLVYLYGRIQYDPIELFPKLEHLIIQRKSEHVVIKFENFCRCPAVSRTLDHLVIRRGELEHLDKRYIRVKTTICLSWTIN